MSNFKKFMAMLLVICMLTGALPMTAWAAETDGTEPSETTEAPAVTEVSEETQETGEPEETTGEDIPTPLADTGLEIGHMATKPGDGTSKDEPFPQNTAGSFSFRIPALVTLSDGTLVAAADARWNTTYDGGGLDTIVARSSDNGANWDYTFANYLGDNGNAYNGSDSTCFIDPSLAVTSDDTIYMLVDLYPYGVALNGLYQNSYPVFTSPSIDVGFNNAGKLRLFNNGVEYYLDGDTIKASADNAAQTGYYVDAYFNLYTVTDGTKTYASNLFFKDSPFQVIRTGYLYLTKSTDKGKTWSAPTLLNLKTADEQVCLVGPNGGMVTKNGTIVFPVYSYANGDQKLSLVYSTDGTTWQRSAALSDPWSSEADVIELGNGNLRAFFRNGTGKLCYADYNLASDTWTTYTKTTVSVNSNTELSVIPYSKTVNGKQVILVSCPTGPNGNGSSSSDGSNRTTGKIFAGLIESDYSITWLDKSVAVTPVAATQLTGSTYAADQGFFGYSSLTEQKDNGSVSILYEDSQQGWGSGTGYGYTMDYKTYTESALETAFDVVFDEKTPNPGEPEKVTVNVTLEVGETKTETISGATLNGNNTDTTIAGVTWTGTDAVKSTAEITSADALADGKQYLIVNKNTGDILSDNVIAVSGNWKNKTGLQTEGKLSADSAELWVIKPTADNSGFYVMQNGKYLAFAGYYASMVDTPTVLTLAHETDGWTLFDGTTYAPDGEPVNPNDHDYYLHDGVGDNYAGGALGNKTLGEKGYWAIYEVTETIPAQTTVSITGNQPGTITVVVDNTTYNITVLADNVTKVENVTLQVGETATYTDNTGNYQDDENNVAPNGDIATMEVVGTTVEGTTSQQLVPVTLPTTENSSVSCYISDGNGNYLANNGTTLTNVTDITNATQWTISFVDTPNWDTNVNKMSRYNVSTTINGYTYNIQLSNGALKLAYTTSNINHWYTAENGFFGGMAGTSGWNYDATNGWTVNASGYGNAKAYTQQTVTTETTHSTTVTFKGVSPGKTYAVVGSTQYNITVTTDMDIVNIEVEVGETFTYTDDSGNYADRTDHVQPDGTHAAMTVSGGLLVTRTPVSTIESGKSYLIINKYTGEILTDQATKASGDWGDRDALATISEAQMTTPELWTITESDGKYTIVRNGKNLVVAGFIAKTDESGTKLVLNYTEGRGWTIYDDTTGPALGHDAAGYYLSDSVGNNYSGSAQGTSSLDNIAVYWDIVEITEVPCTEVSFNGIAPGNTTAQVGNTLYNITVVQQETDDEVDDIGAGIWIVDPEIQRKQYNDLTAGKTKDQYTDDSWSKYEVARKGVYMKLAEIANTQYTSQADADAALQELIELNEKLNTAVGNLVAAKIISIEYTKDGTKVDTVEYKVRADDTAMTVPTTIVAGGMVYTVINPNVTLEDGKTTYQVPVKEDGKQGGGFVGSTDIDFEDYHNNVRQVCDLVDDSGVGRKITEMTLTVGVSYNLDLASDTTDKTVEWTSGNTDVVTVDQDGNVTAVGTGTTIITAVVKDANGNVVEVNRIPVTVFPKGDGDRKTGIYIEDVDSTTIWCAVNADTDSYGFEVVEGELIYGQFDKQQTSGTYTTAMSFFGAPDEAHALVYMKSTGSDDHYFLLHGQDGSLYDGAGEDGPNGSYYVSGTTGGAGYWQAVGLGDNKEYPYTNWAPIKDMVQWAIDKGCDGGLGFTRRQNEVSMASNLTFASIPTPKLDKVVDGVLPTSGKFDNYQRYVEDMVAAVDEVVFFKITVTLERPTHWSEKDGVIQRDEYGQIGAITYSNAFLKDLVLEDNTTPFMDAYFYTKEDDQKDGVWDGQFTYNRTNIKEITEELNKGWADTEQIRVREYYLVYKIQEKDIPKFNIENTATLEFDYKSYYSTGAVASAADATAKITVIGVAMDNVVIDFGQTVEYTGLTNRHLKGVYVDGENDDGVTTKCHATAKYGTVTVVRQPRKVNGVIQTDGNGYTEYDYTVTYTPTCILQGPDMVLLYGVGENNQEKVINGFIVYPATTVYYEEGFAFPAMDQFKPTTATEWDFVTTDDNKKWDLSNARAATAVQTFEKLGRTEVNGNVYTIVSDKQNAYGFDPMYINDPNLDNGFALTDDIGAITRFVFTGEGIQIYAKCTSDPSGYVAVEVREAAPPHKLVRLAMVNTKVSQGDTGATEDQTGTLEGLPVVSLVNIEGMPHGRYIVSIAKVVDTKPVYIDGFRVINTIQSVPDSSPFTIDLEDQPEFYELRDAVLHAVGVNTNPENGELTSEDYEKMTEQVYNEVQGASALITDERVDYANSNTIQDLLDNGPKNELYIYPGQTLTFNVTTDRVMQVGMKAPQGTTTADVTVNDTVKQETISSSVDMFHYLIDKPAGTDTLYTVSIKNTGDEILSITLLKICDDPMAAFTPLTQQDIENIVMANVKPIVIESQPADQAVKMGERYNVEVIARGNNLKYQWYFRNAGDTVFHKSGVRDNTYDDVMTAARAGREVYCVITDAEGNSVTTDTARIDVIPETKLELLQQPTDQAVKMGERYNVEVIAQGEGLKYRWFFRNKGSEQFSASGVKDNTYDDVMTAARAGREVYCVITDAYGNKVTTNTVTLNVLPNAALEIVQQPVNGEAKLGETFLVEVIAQGDGLRYQWFYRNAGSGKFVKSGVRDNTYDDVMTAARAGREVYCVITDAYGNSVTTDTVKLIAIPSETLEIVQQPVDAEAKLGEKYLVEVLAKGEGLRYQWFYRNAGSTKFVKSGVRDNTYDDVMTAARAGREVYCVITDAYGNSVTTDTVKLIALPSETLEIVQQPVNSEAKLGEMYLVEVVAKGDGLRYQWYFRNAGETEFHKSGVRDNTYDDVMTKARAGREVYCVITDTFGNSVTTETVKLICVKDDAQMVTND